jgi:hypothetical protein
MERKILSNAFCIASVIAGGDRVTTLHTNCAKLDEAKSLVEGESFCEQTVQCETTRLYDTCEFVSNIGLQGLDYLAESSVHCWYPLRSLSSVNEARRINVDSQQVVPTVNSQQVVPTVNSGKLVRSSMLSTAEHHTSTLEAFRSIEYVGLGSSSDVLHNGHSACIQVMLSIKRND